MSQTEIRLRPERERLKAKLTFALVSAERLRLSADICRDAGQITLASMFDADADLHAEIAERLRKSLGFPECEDYAI